jgi:hypothetical protein
MVSGSLPKVGSTCNKITKVESLEKYDSTKFEGVQLQDERAPLKFQVFHHEDVALRSNPEMTPKAVLHSLIWFGAHKR